MRQAFIDAMCQLALKNPRIMLITGDLGYRFLDTFAERFPAQFLNIGVSEADMVSVAAGLSTCGFVPFIYSIATFASMRAFEQIRDDICLQNLNVKIVGIGAGFAYTKAGPTHHSFEDIALMRTLPNMTIVCPVDPPQARSAAIALAALSGPAYLRLERNPEKSYYNKPPEFTVGRGYTVEEGKQTAIIVTGTKIGFAQKIISLVKHRNFHPSIIGLPTVEPLDVKLLKQLSRTHKNWITLEEHRINGGLGSAVLEWLNDVGLADRTRLLRIGLTDGFNPESGDYGFLLSQNHMTPDQIAVRIDAFISHG
jgi:transketolase